MIKLLINLAFVKLIRRKILQPLTGFRSWGEVEDIETAHQGFPLFLEKTG